LFGTVDHETQNVQSLTAPAQFRPSSGTHPNDTNIVFHSTHIPRHFVFTVLTIVCTPSTTSLYFNNRIVNSNSTRSPTRFCTTCSICAAVKVVCFYIVCNNERLREMKKLVRKKKAHGAAHFSYFVQVFNKQDTRTTRTTTTTKRHTRRPPRRTLPLSASVSRYQQSSTFFFDNSCCFLLLFMHG
jgi:hypothetical protein